jgi:hypothetical protein
VSDDEAVLVLQTVKVNGRPAQLLAFPDRLLLVDPSGSRAIPVRDLARIAHKAGLRKGRLLITTGDGEILEIRGLKTRDTPTAYRILVGLAKAAQS